MKFTGISMTVLMLLAIVLRSLPDSVFNYFHSHTHVSYADHSPEKETTVSDYKHNCQIEDWNFESFEVNETGYQTIQNIQLQPVFFSREEPAFSKWVSQIGRGPPTV